MRPQLSLLIITLILTHKINQLKRGGQGPIPLSHANVFGGRKLNLPALNTQVGGQAVLGRQNILPTPWLTERHGYDPTSQLSLLIITLVLENQLKIGGQGPIPLSHANVFGGRD